MIKAHDVTEIAAGSSIPDNEQFRVSDDEEGGTRVGDIFIPPPVPPYCSSESKGNRLIITNIIIENFKSYAGKVELGPFNHCTSSIIGPNGSGKSNVIDAMLFVFGYRTQKLRLKKLSALIHKSTRVFEMDHCSVYIYFQQIEDLPNGDCKLVPNTEYMISRTAHSNNTSFYSINHTRKHFKEVSKLLKQHGIDLDHNRFLILQGEVESIALMKPKANTPNECGFLEYLEDIIGTSRYIEPLAKIDTRVEYLNEQRTEKHNRCKLSERDMKDLKKPFDEAIEYLKLENQITRSKNVQFQIYLRELRNKSSIFEEERVTIAENVKEQENNYSEIQLIRVEKEELLKGEIKKCDDLIKTKEDYETHYRNSINKAAELQATLKSQNTRRKQTLANILKEKQKLDQMKNIPGENKKGIDEAQTQLNKQLAKKSEQEEILAANLSNLNDETKDLIEKKVILQTKLIGLKGTVDETNSNFNVAKSELEMYQYQQTTEANRLKKYEEFLKNCEDTKMNHHVELTKKTKEQLALQTVYEEKQHLTKQLLEEETILTSKLNEKNAEIQAFNTVQQSHNRNKIVQALMEQKRLGNIIGILGRLGDLGGIDAKYDIAISTCCGQLDNLVVESIETGEACIEHLKRHNLGRASFIALDKISHLDEHCRNRIQTPENVPRLFDLITIEDERVRPAFYFALHDTLVADNLERGTRIAFGRQRYRVVTLKGDVIEAHGTMSGGGQPIRGRMGQNVRTKTFVNKNRPTVSIEQLQNELQNICEQISSNQEKQLALEKEIQPIVNDLRKRAGFIKKLKLEYDSSVKQLPSLREQYERQAKILENVKIDQTLVVGLKQKVNSANILYEKAETDADKISAEVDNISKQVNYITDKKLKSVQMVIKMLDKDIQSLNSQISKLIYEIKAAERNCKQTEGHIEQLNDEVKKFEESIKNDSKLRDENDLAAKNMMIKIEEVRDIIEKAQIESKTARKIIDQIQKQENEARIKKHELEEQLKAIDKSIADVKSQVPNWQKKLKPLKLNEILRGEAEEPLKTYTEGELEKHKIQDLQYQISILEAEISSRKPNLSIIEEYEIKRNIYLERVAHLEDITVKRNEMRALYENVRKKRFNEFTQGFYIISKKVKEMYQAITIGGDAELELVDSMDPFTEGIIFSVRPPKKSWKQITNLSGGEKTLTSLSLVFALHYYKPSPLYIMDEIDAALDFKNVSIIANYIKQRAKNAQFIIISLRANMFELCEVLVGIYKVYDCSASIAIKNYPPEFISTEEQGVPNNQTDSNQILLPSDLINSGTEETKSDDKTTANNADNNPP